MTKIVYNACYGGFSLSSAAVRRIRELSGNPKWGGCVLFGEPYEDGSGICELRWDSVHPDSDEELRADPFLVQVVEEMGDAANGECARLRIADIPAGTRYRIDEYDGNERVMTQDDYEWSVA